jgi:hypothetical protein
MISSSAAEVSSREAACCSVRLARSFVALLNSLELLLIVPELTRTFCMASRRLATAAFTFAWSSAKAPRKLPDIVWVRSPWARDLTTRPVSETPASTVSIRLSTLRAKFVEALLAEALVDPFAEVALGSGTDDRFHPRTKFVAARPTSAFLLVHAGNLNAVLLEDLHGICHLADLVDAAATGNIRFELAIGDALHCGSEIQIGPLSWRRPI